jgi:hypothetical protein
MNTDNSGFLGALEDGLLQISGADIREKGEEVKAQRHGVIVVRSAEGHKPGVSVLESFHANCKDFNHGLHRFFKSFTIRVICVIRGCFF